MNKPDPITNKPANRPPTQFTKPQAGSLQVVIKVTELEPMKKFIEAIAYASDKVEDGDISKETAYNMIMRACDAMRQDIKERSDEQIY